jgi:general secretion pathway protein A
MYNAYFGFHEKPFNITPDPRFLYANSSYEEAYANLFYGLRERKGFIVLTGEVGTGKTTLLRKLIDSLEDSTRFVLFYNTTLTFEELLDFAFAELGLDIPQGGRLQKIQALNQFLITQLAQGGIVALLIDEAQNLSDDILENLRLLSNLETAQEKLLQIVLVGQPELDTKLAQPHLRQLKQRITTRCNLVRLRESEIGPFIAHRLRTVGYEGPPLFSPEAVQRLTVYCQGIPRLINVICDSALLLAYGASQKSVTPSMIDEVARDLQLSAPIPGATPIATSRHITKPIQDTLAPSSNSAPISISPLPQRPQEKLATPTNSPRQAEEKTSFGFRSPYANRRLAWASISALILFSSFIAYGMWPQEGTLTTVSQQEQDASESSRSGVAWIAQALNERLSSLLAPLIPAANKQKQRHEAGQAAAAQEVEPATDPASGPQEIEGDSSELQKARSTTASLEPPMHKAEEQVEQAVTSSLASQPQDQAEKEEQTTEPSARQNAPIQHALTPALMSKESTKQHVRLLQAGETISSVVREVYGNYNSLALDLIKELNPHLEDLDRVAAGQKIWFPPLTQDTLLRAQSDSAYHLIVATFRHAAPAERFAQTLRAQGYRSTITSRRVSESVLLHRVEITDLADQEETQRAWRFVNPTNVYFVAPQIIDDLDSTETISPQEEAVDLPETGL